MTRTRPDRKAALREVHHAAEHVAWFRHQVQIGLDAANAGNLIPAADVEANLAAKRAATRRRLEGYPASKADRLFSSSVIAYENVSDGVAIAYPK